MSVFSGKELQSVSNMSSLKFKSLLVDISGQLSEDHLNKLKFLVQDVVGKRELERITSGYSLFQVLMERGKVAADKTEYLSQLLVEIQRQDLSDKLNDWDSQVGAAAPAVPEPERAKLDIATEVIAENLGRSWRKLGRKLGISDVKLESIANRHPTELEETVVELMKEWRKSRGAEANTKELMEALRACHFNLTADKVEDRILAHECS